MLKKVLLPAALAVAALFAAGEATTAEAASPKTPTVITVGGMCGGCVKKITARFDKIDGVAGVRCDVKKQMVTVGPEKGYVLSPRGLWEEMEKLGKPPKKLAGPQGVFTSKPKE